MLLASWPSTGPSLVPTPPYEYRGKTGGISFATGSSFYSDSCQPASSLTLSGPRDMFQIILPDNVTLMWRPELWTPVNRAIWIIARWEAKTCPGLFSAQISYDQRSNLRSWVNYFPLEIQTGLVKSDDHLNKR